MRVRGFPWQKAALAVGLAWLVVAVVRRPSRAPLPQPDRREAPQPPASRSRERERGSVLARSVALVFLATLLFALGAALGGALGASADDGTPVAADSSSTATDTPATDTTTPVATTTEPATSEATTTAPAPTTTDSTPVPPPVATGGSAHHHHHSVSSSQTASPAPRAKRHHYERAPITWVPRVLSDPIPKAHRLSPSFAESLRAAARAHDVGWWQVLAVLRAHGHDGRVPARAAKLDTVARRLSRHKIRLDKQIYSLGHYDRAVSLPGLVKGLEGAKPRLEQRILRDRRIGLTWAGASDVASGRVDVRVLVVIRYLAFSFHQVTVASLITGHPFLARKRERIVSAHMDGLAVDISSLRGIPIYGNQQVGSITERAIEALLRLPQELQPKQIISLLGLGGPSFPLRNHYDHIHVGF